MRLLRWYIRSLDKTMMEMMEMPEPHRSWILFDFIFFGGSIR